MKISRSTFVMGVIIAFTGLGVTFYSETASAGSGCEKQCSRSLGNPILYDECLKVCNANATGLCYTCPSGTTGCGCAEKATIFEPTNSTGSGCQNQIFNVQFCVASTKASRTPYSGTLCFAPGASHGDINSGQKPFVAASCPTCIAGQGIPQNLASTVVKCAACTGKTFSPGGFSAQCTTCGSGTKPNSDHSACVPKDCPAGQGFNSSHQCVPCTGNTFSAGGPTAQCTPCGTGANPTHSACLPPVACPASATESELANWSANCVWSYQGSMIGPATAWVPPGVVSPNLINFKNVPIGSLLKTPTIPSLPADNSKMNCAYSSINTYTGPTAFNYVFRCSTTTGCN
jgi:hypothetical protein